MKLDDILKRTDVPEDVKVHIQSMLFDRFTSEQALAERVKELNGLYKLGILTVETENIVQMISRFEKEVIRESMQFPDKVHVGFQLDGKHYVSCHEHKPGEIPYNITIPIFISGKQRGELTVGYLEDFQLDMDFEQRLIEGYAIKLGHHFERIELVQSLKDSEEKYKIVFESSADGILIADTETMKFKYINQSLYKMLGYTKQELLSKSVMDIHPQKDLDYVISEFESQARGEKTLAVNIPCLRKDGTVVYADINTTKINIDGRDHNIGIFRDITERKQIEEILRESKKRLELVLIGGNLGTWDYDIPSGNTHFDERWLSMLGYEPSDVEQNVNGWNNLIHPDDQPIVLEKLQAHFEDPSVVYEVEMRLKTKSGDYKWIFGKGEVLERSEDGKPIRMTGTHLDITERKQTEKAIIENHRLSAMGELAYGVAHDFNNGLQSIFGGVELALTQDLPPEARAELIVVKKSATNAASRVRQLQRFAGKKDESLEYSLINITETVNDAITQTKTLWKDEMQRNGLNIEIKTNYQDGLNILGDQGDLRSVLYNLIKNSVQAMPEGGTIDISTRKENEFVYLTLTDTGIGMDEDVQQRIFDPFFTTKGFEQGKGLGMSGAYSIIKEHNAQIYVVKSAPGTGTTFEIKIPYAERRKTPRNETKAEYIGSAKVLWVDDEAQILKFGKIMLTNFGHETDVVSSGAEALELLATNQYDLMITDVGMPGMSGWQLAEQVKGKYQRMKVAVVSGWGNDVSTEQKKEYGVGYVLGKPIEMKELKNLINEVIQMKTK